MKRTSKRFWPVLVVLPLLAWLAWVGAAAAHDHWRRAGYAAGMAAGYSAGFAAQHQVATVAVAVIENCAGPQVFIRVDSDGRIYLADARHLDPEQQKYIEALTKATGGIAHIRYDEGCV